MSACEFSMYLLSKDEQKSFIRSRYFSEEKWLYLCEEVSPAQENFSRASPRSRTGTLTLVTTNGRISTNSWTEKFYGVRAKFRVVRNMGTRKGRRRCSSATKRRLLTNLMSPVMNLWFKQPAEQVFNESREGSFDFDRKLTEWKSPSLGIPRKQVRWVSLT